MKVIEMIIIDLNTVKILKYFLLKIDKLKNFQQKTLNLNFLKILYWN